MNSGKINSPLLLVLIAVLMVGLGGMFDFSAIYSSSSPEDNKNHFCIYEKGMKGCHNQLFHPEKAEKCSHPSHLQPMEDALSMASGIISLSQTILRNEGYFRAIQLKPVLPVHFSIQLPQNLAPSLIPRGPPQLL